MSPSNPVRFSSARTEVALDADWAVAKPAALPPAAEVDDLAGSAAPAGAGLDVAHVVGEEETGVAGAEGIQYGDGAGLPRGDLLGALARVPDGDVAPRRNVLAMQVAFDSEHGRLDHPVHVAHVHRTHAEQVVAPFPKTLIRDGR